MSMLFLQNYQLNPQTQQAYARQKARAWASTFLAERILAEQCQARECVTGGRCRVVDKQCPLRRQGECPKW